MQGKCTKQLECIVAAYLRKQPLQGCHLLNAVVYGRSPDKRRIQLAREERLRKGLQPMQEHLANLHMNAKFISQPLC